MTTEELILGHFDRALTPQEEKLLQQRLSASPEARAMYEQHRNLDGYLSNDAMSLAPSAHLDEMTLAAALSAVPELISGGSSAWFSGKIAATVAAVIVGGASIALLTTSGSNQNAVPVQSAPPAVVRTLPAAPAQATPPQTAPASQPAAHMASPAPTVTEHPAARSASVAATPKVRESKPTFRKPSVGTVDDGIKIHPSNR